MKKINLLTTLCILGLLVFNTGMAFGQVVNSTNKKGKSPYSDITNGGQILDIEEEERDPTSINNGDELWLSADKDCKVQLSIYLFATNVVENWPTQDPMILKFSALGFTQYFRIYQQNFFPISSVSSEPMFIHVTRIEFDVSVLCTNPNYSNGTSDIELALVSSQITDAPFPINEYAEEGQIFSCDNFDDCSAGGMYPLSNEDGYSPINIRRSIYLECSAFDCAVNNAAENPKDRSQAIQNQSASSFELSLAPNPAADYTQLNYSLEQASEVSYIYFDATGKKISESNDWQNAGYHQKMLNTNSWAPGLYWIQLKVGDQVETKRLVKY